MSRYMGLNMTTGRAVTDHDHLAQSITKILTTPIGSRVMRREFGSLLPDLMDHPLNDSTVVLLYAASATALVRQEPRLRLTRVQLQPSDQEPGRSDLIVNGYERDQDWLLSIPVRLP
ncbi:GPW/gp25 family protein [Alcaligenes sp. RM2]